MKTLIISIMLLGQAASLSTDMGLAAAGAIEELNTVRMAAGLVVLEADEQLRLAALSHAEYLARYMPQGGASSGSAHEQHAGLPEFTGQFAADRAASFGYAHTQVTENVSIGNKSVAESISSLMSAIYHRLAFLDPKVDQLGFAEVEHRYVFNMGRRNLADTCEAQNDSARPVPPYNCLGQQMNASAYTRLCEQLPDEARYTKPYANRCPNGSLLNERFMLAVCEQPPAGAVLSGAGRYYNICNNGLKIAASWLDGICQSSDANVVYPYSGSYYEICTPEQRVHSQWYEHYCENLPADARVTDSGSYYQVCNNGFRVKTEYLDQQRANALMHAPEAILWPADGVRNVQPVFYDEDPHPTPDLPQTGYPVSVQFNPQNIKQVSIMGFSLEELDESQAEARWQIVSPVRLIDQQSDINAKLSEYQFVWFPLQRLKWATQYRYRIDALVDGSFKTYGARFHTTRLPLPVYEVRPETGQVTVAEKRFILYREPDAFDDAPFREVSLSYRGRPYVDVSVIDTNTLELNVGGDSCAPVLLSTRLNEQIKIDFCGKSRRLRSLF